MLVVKYIYTYKAPDIASYGTYVSPLACEHVQGYLKHYQDQVNTEGRVVIIMLQNYFLQQSKKAILSMLKILLQNQDQ